MTHAVWFAFNHHVKGIWTKGQQKGIFMYEEGKNTHRLALLGDPLAEQVTIEKRDTARNCLPSLTSVLRCLEEISNCSGK